MNQIDVSKLSREIKNKYQIIDNTFIATIKKDPKDKIDIELGDSKTLTEILPQQKIMRWDNECNVSIRLKDFTDYIVETDKEVVKLVNHTKEVHFYDFVNEEIQNKETYNNQTTIVNELNITPSRLVSLYELNKHKDNKSNYAIISTISEPSLLFYGRQSLDYYYDNPQYPVRRFLTNGRGNPMYDDGGLVWAFILGCNLDYEAIQKFLNAIIDELVKIGFDKKKFSIIRGYKLFYNGKKLSSVNIEDGELIAYVNYDCDYNKSMDLYKNGVERDSNDEICRLKQINENITTELVENAVKNVLTLLQKEYKNGEISSIDESLVSEKSLIAVDNDWILYAKRSDLKPNIYNSTDGAREFEVILKEKPKTNKLEFTLVDKDVEYLYQPELTQEEINKGMVRPDNVVGSYAVYAKTPKINYVGGKEYKCGKMGHIFRPKIIDSNGLETWGELHIENGILSVTIPQDFLDKAVYPIRHAAGLTFGNTSEGTTNTYAPADPDIMAIGLYTSGYTNTVDSISVYAKHAGGAGNYKGIITNSSKSILTNGVGGATAYPSTVGWTTSTFSTPPSVSASTNYYLGVIANGGFYSNGMQVYADATGGAISIDSSNSYTTPTNPTDANYINANNLSIYATYTASGPSTEIKSINALAKASVKSVNGLAIASVKSINGLA